MSFDVPKLVRSPGSDHGHDEESRNCRDVKIDILDDYIRTSERFRVIRVFPEVPGSYGNTRKKQWALMGLVEEVEMRPRGSCAPLPPVRIGQGGGGAPLSFLSPSSFPLLLLQLGKEGVLLPVGVGLLPGTPPPGRPPLPLDPLYTGAGGHPRDTTIDRLIF